MVRNIERVIVHVEANSEDTVATIHWIGGFESRYEFARPVRTYKQLQEGDLLTKRLVELREAGKSAEQTADILNAEGVAPINPGKKFNRVIVRKLLLKLGRYGETTTRCSDRANGGFVILPKRSECRGKRCANGPSSAGFTDGKRKSRVSGWYGRTMTR